MYRPSVIVSLSDVSNFNPLIINSFFIFSFSNASTLLFRFRISVFIYTFFYLSSIISLSCLRSRFFISFKSWLVYINFSRIISFLSIFSFFLSFYHIGVLFVSLLLAPCFSISISSPRFFLYSPSVEPSSYSLTSPRILLRLSYKYLSISLAFGVCIRETAVRLVDLGLACVYVVIINCCYKCIFFFYFAQKLHCTVSPFTVHLYLFYIFTVTNI